MLFYIKRYYIPVLGLSKCFCIICLGLLASLASVARLAVFPPKLVISQEFLFLVVGCLKHSRLGFLKKNMYDFKGIYAWKVLTGLGGF